MTGPRTTRLLLLAASVTCALGALAVLAHDSSDVDRCRVEVVAALKTLPRGKALAAASGDADLSKLEGWTAFAPTTTQADRARELLSTACDGLPTEPEITVIK